MSLHVEGMQGVVPVDNCLVRSKCYFVRILKNG